MVTNRRGFSLIESMVAMGMMSLGLLAILQVLAMQMKVSNTTKMDSEVANTVFLVNAVLKNSSACKDNIGNFGNKVVSLPASPNQKLKVNSLDFPSGGGKIVTANTPSAQQAAYVKDMNLTNFKLLSSFGGFTILSSELEMLFEKPSAVGSQVTKRKVSVQLRTNGSGLIVDCSGEGTELTDFQLNSICTSNGGTFDFTSKKCKLPEPVIPPPQIIVQQIPVPVPANLPAAGSSSSTVASNNSANNANSGMTASSNGSSPSTGASVVNNGNSTTVAAAPPPPPPAPKTALYTVTNPYCNNVGLITTNPTCSTRSFGFDGQGNTQFYYCAGSGAGILYDVADTCPNTPL